MKRRLFFLALSVIVLISLIILLFIYAFNADNKLAYIITLIGLIFLTVYSIRMVIKEYLSYKLDLKEGLHERVMIFCQLNVKVNSDPKYVQPTEPTATFKMADTGEFIDLYGDYSKIKLQKGNRYKVSFYRYSRRISSIREAYRSER